jgi:dipeptidyl aminopeptidase/acylaminoacyl peptidase
MSARPDLDRSITAWLDAQAPMREPNGLLERVTDDLARTRRLPGWVIPERWLPMQTTARFGPGARAVILMTVLAALLAVSAAIVVASQPRPAPPTGPARNGLIAYDAFGDIWTMRPDGSDRRQLTGGPALDLSPTWSPDGTRIAFASWPNQDAIGPDGEGFDAAARRWMPQSPSIVVMEADGSDATTMGTMLGPAALSWAPDSIRFVYDTGSGLRIGSTAPEGQTTSVLEMGEEVSLIDGPGSSPAWSPDGRSIAYKGGQAADSTLGLWIIDVESGASRLVSEPIGPSEEITGASWAPDGNSIAFYVGPASGGAFDVHAAAADGSGEEPITTDGPDEYFPSWAPDGSRLAFDRVVVPSNNLVQIVVFDPLTSTELMLESPPLFGIGPVWSPDSTVVVAQLPANPEVESAWGWASHLVFLDSSGATGPRLVEADGAFGTQSWQRLAP